MPSVHARLFPSLTNVLSDRIESGGAEIMWFGAVKNSRFRCDDSTPTVLSGLRPGGCSGHTRLSMLSARTLARPPDPRDRPQAGAAAGHVSGGRPGIRLTYFICYTNFWIKRNISGGRTVKLTLDHYGGPEAARTRPDHHDAQGMCAQGDGDKPTLQKFIELGARVEGFARSK